MKGRTIKHTRQQFTGKPQNQPATPRKPCEQQPLQPTPLHTKNTTHGNPYPMQGARWWAGPDSNRRSPRCERGVLTKLNHRPNSNKTTQESNKTLFPGPTYPNNKTEPRKKTSALCPSSAWASGSCSDTCGTSSPSGDSSHHSSCRQSC